MSTFLVGQSVNIDGTNLLWWLIVGLIAGVLASAITRSSNGIIGDIILGIIGAFVGGFILSLLNITTYGLLGTILAATLGAIVVILLVRAITGRGRRRVF
ncbi:MAG: GlsB/YeaQ/YmgE family stress response rane protein [Chloroflexi bacterium]|jgi:uncharacterized membrane protein YeaQ/YmgE (transglycosylase-associated protein family)|nr:GlsB/YeaQ/YmgE family stress response rane protein [Chloroflexota bacterium]